MKDASEIQDGRDDMPIFIHSALDDYGLSPVEFRVYGRLARRCGRGTGFESVPNMAKDFEVSERTVQRCLRLLVECRLISSTPREGKSTLYTLNPQKLWQTSGLLKETRERVFGKKEKRADLGVSGDTREGGVTAAGGDTTAAGVVSPERGVGVTPETDEGTPSEGTPDKILPKDETTRARAEGEPPEWLESKVWRRWLKHRREVRHPVTTQQAEAQFRVLDKFRAREMRPEDVIEQSIAHGWQGLFELKAEANGNGQQQRTDGQHQRGSNVSPRTERQNRNANSLVAKSAALRERAEQLRGDREPDRP
jgi:DNA-binding transcriptional ArsR family regulator